MRRKRSPWDAPCVDFMFEKPPGRVFLCARRWSPAGEGSFADGRCLFDRVDFVVGSEAALSELGAQIRAAFSLCGVVSEDAALPPLLWDMIPSPHSEGFFEGHHLGAICTLADATTPYRFGATLTDRVDIDSLTVGKQASDEEMGEALRTLIAEVTARHWPRT